MIKILFLAANPVSTNKLQLEDESRMIDKALRMTAFRDNFDIRSHWAVHYDDLQELLMRYEPNIVHFSGHGTSAGETIFDEGNGGENPVSPQALSHLFTILKGKIRCVVLNACFSQIQAKEIAESIDCVVGMSKDISDAAAIDFATAFYQCLGYGKNVQEAFDLARNRIASRNLGEQDTPQLLTPHANPQQVVFVGKESQNKPNAVLHFVTSNKTKFDLYDSLLSDIAKLKQYPERIEENPSIDLELITKAKLISAKEKVRGVYPKDPFFIEQFALRIDAWENLPAGLSSLFVHRIGCDKICLMMNRLNEPERSASLEMRIHYSHGKVEVPFSDVVAGSIAREPKKVGTYLEVDTIFIPKEIPSSDGWIPNKEGKTLSELGEETKKKIWANLGHVVEFREFLQRTKRSRE